MFICPSRCLGGLSSRGVSLPCCSTPAVSLPFLLAQAFSGSRGQDPLPRHPHSAVLALLVLEVGGLRRPAQIPEEVGLWERALEGPS